MIWECIVRPRCDLQIANQISHAVGPFLPLIKLLPRAGQGIRVDATEVRSGGVEQPRHAVGGPRGTLQLDIVEVRVAPGHLLDLAIENFGAIASVRGCMPRRLDTSE